MDATPDTELRAMLADNAVWLRRIACALVGDSAADDLVGDTVEAALRNPPDTSRPLRPWLSRVMRNRAKMSWRSANRRVRRELDYAAPAARAHGDAGDRHPGQLDAGERAVLHNHLASAVANLGEPHREAVVLRFVDGLSAAEIARRKDVPAATVRSWLKRSLERLRSDLDENQPRARWMAALLPLAAPGPTPIPAALAVGALLMKITIPIALIATVAVIVASSGRGPAAADGPSTTADSRATKADRLPTSSDRPAMAGAPKRFRDPEERLAFQASLLRARARRRESHRPRKTYDFAGTDVSSHAPATNERLAAPAVDKDYLKDRIGEVIPLVRECYELALHRDESIAGNLVLDFIIDAEEEVGGYVREAAVDDDSTITDAAMHECVLETILSLELVAPEGGGEVRVRYPFEFAVSE